MNDAVQQQSAVTALSKFCDETGISRFTLWRWRKLGWVRFINIAGRWFITDDDKAEFFRRAGAGEFSSHHPVPPRKKGFQPGDKIEAEVPA